MFGQTQNLADTVKELEGQVKSLRSDMYEMITLFHALKRELGYEVVENQNRDRWTIKKVEK